LRFCSHLRWKRGGDFFRLSQGSGEISAHGLPADWLDVSPNTCFLTGLTQKSADAFSDVQMPPAKIRAVSMAISPCIVDAFALLTVCAPPTQCLCEILRGKEFRKPHHLFLAIFSASAHRCASKWPSSQGAF
jgi:hypothetical protein